MCEEVHEDKRVISPITEDQEELQKGMRRSLSPGVRRYGLSRQREKKEPRKGGMKTMYRKGPHSTTPHFKSQLYPLKRATTSKLRSFPVPQFSYLPIRGNSNCCLKRDEEIHQESLYESP